MDLDKFIPSLNKTQLREEISTYKMPLQIVGIVVVITIILTCCCTLHLRKKLMALVNKVVGKKKKDRLSSLDVEKGKRESKSDLIGVKKIQKKETKPVTQNVTQPVPQLAMTTSSIQAEPSPTGCCKCFKKKRKKTRKKHKR
ncbi:uncharacterized protein LOC124424655 [Vespa crabro]|uniref:uncharacterized protein LOC124424655 n=1 Tax=Vespa crabro TaxID=7445 RepID=UPI001F004D34|nr:uncharacterized protein LOC124424655 [Vespa crabro]